MKNAQTTRNSDMPMPRDNVLHLLPEFEGAVERATRAHRARPARTRKAVGTPHGEPGGVATDALTKGDADLSESIAQLRQRARRIRESAKRYGPEVANRFLEFAAELDRRVDDKIRSRKKPKPKTDVSAA
jgi:hypothetical protein